MKQVVTLIGLLAMASAVGCGDAADDAETSLGTASETSEDTGSIISAGSESLELGVDHWQVKADGVALGFDADNQRIAEFRLDGAARVVRSLAPDRGVLALDRSEGALSPRSLALFEALVLDVQTRTEDMETTLASDADGLVNKAIYGCYWLYHDCDIQGFQGILNGWWTGYICQISSLTRPYCGDYWALLY